MTKRQLFFIFIAMMIAPLITALCFAFFIHQNGPILPPEAVTPSFSYAFGIVCAVSTTLGVFLALNKTRANPILRMALLTTPALMVVMGYYFFDDHNFLYYLPFLAVAAFMLLYRVMQN
ncbi:MAG: hypothetical protein K5945_02885 [Bacteroidaceae bacterium]|nr:hypothetical protein [Bacteroidaceae bacterium]